MESYLDYHGDKLVRRFDANTYLVLSEAMNHHDVGRDRGGIAAALATVTADVDHRRACRRTGSTRCACSRSSAS